ncbi:MAG: hypothetical protein IJO33_01920 [Bacilli bacterium]|nr:hypothetical protein [Bacilli bacterium]
MNNFVKKKLSSYTIEDINFAKRCLSLDELTLLEVEDCESFISTSLNFICDKMIEFIELRNFIYTNKTIYDYFKNLCPFKIRFDNTLKKLNDDEANLIKELFNSKSVNETNLEIIFNKIIPQINYDLIVNSSHTEPYFEAYFKGYNITNIKVILSNLTNIELNILHKAFGKNLDQMIDYKNLSGDERTILNKDILTKITSYLTRAQSFKYKFDLKNIFEENKIDNIDSIINKLSDEEKLFIYRSFNCDLQSYDNVLELSKKDYDYLTLIIIPSINNVINNELTNKVYVKFLNFFKNNNLEEILPKLLKLKSKDLKFLVELYGDNLDNTISSLLDEKVLNQLNKIIKQLNNVSDENTNTLQKSWENLVKDQSKNVLKLSFHKLDETNKKIVYKIVGEDLENLSNPLFETLTIEQMWDLNNNIFKKLKENIRLFSSNITNEQQKDDYKYFLDKVFINYKKEDVLAAVATLNTTYIEYLFSLYGKNLNRPLLVWSKKQFNDVINIVIPHLKNLLEDENFKKELINMQHFAKMFNESNKIIRRALSKLDEKELQTIQILYGKKRTARLKVSIPNYDYIVFRKYTINKIKKLFVAVKTVKASYKYFFEIFSEYSREKVLEAFSLLPKNHQKTLKKMYGDNLEERLNFKGITSGDYNNFREIILPKIIKFLNTNKMEFGPKMKYRYFFEIFGNNEYINQKVMQVITGFPPNYKIILEKAYGVDYREKLNTKNLLDGEYTILRCTLIPKIRTYLKSGKISFGNVGKYNYFFEIFNKDKETVLKEFNLLETKYQIIIKRIYGDDLSGAQCLEKLSNNERQNFYQVIIPKLEKQLNNEEQFDMHKNQYFFNIYANTYEGTRKILKAFSCLPNKHQNILRKIYGEDLKGKMDLSKVKNSEYYIFTKTILSRIDDLYYDRKIKYANQYSYSVMLKLFNKDEQMKNKALELINTLSKEDQLLLQKVFGINYDCINIVSLSMDEINLLKGKLIPDLKENLSEKKDRDIISKYEDFFAIFGENEDIKQKVLKGIDVLPEKYKIVLYNIYGKNLNQYREMSPNEYGFLVKQIIPKIKLFIEYDNVNFGLHHKYEYLLDYFESEGISKDVIKEKVKYLSLKYQNILFKLYGPNLDEKMNRKNISNKEYSRFSNNIIKELLYMAQNNTNNEKETKFSDLYKVLNITFDDKQILLDAINKLPKKYQEIIISLYGKELNDYKGRSGVTKNEYVIFIKNIYPKLKGIIAGDEVCFGQTSAYRNFFALFQEITKDKGLILEKVKLLPNEYKDILEKLYGNTLNNYNGAKEVLPKEWKIFVNKIVPGIKALLNNEDVQFEKQSKYHNLFKLFGDDEKIVIQVKEKVNLLPEKYQQILIKLYGENLDDYQGYLAISHSDFNIFSSVIIPKIRLLLDGQELDFDRVVSRGKYADLFALFEEDQNIVKKAIEKLSDRQQEMLKKLYGNDYSDKLIVKDNNKLEYNNFIRTILPKLKMIVQIVNQIEMVFSKIESHELYIKLNNILLTRDVQIWFLISNNIQVNDITIYYGVNKGDIINSLKNSFNVLNNILNENKIFSEEEKLQLLLIKEKALI